MARIRLCSLMLVVLAVSVPGEASTAQDVSCSESISPGGTATCVTAFRIPHFDPDDAIDYETLIARIVSPQADSWKVQAKISDGKGKVYFAWECVARRSTVTAAGAAYFDRTCQGRRTVATTEDGQTSTTYYTASTSKPQILTVTAWVGGCVPSGTSPCRFEAAATYLLS